MTAEKLTVEEYRKAAAPSEEIEQIHLFTWAKWAESKYPFLSTLYHIPNEGKRTAATGGKMKAAGLKKGMPDICLPVSKGGYSGLYIEMKKIGGKPTPEQIDCLELLEKYGNCVAICEGAEKAEEVILAYCKRDQDMLDRLCLFHEYHDFEKLRGAGKKKKKSSEDDRQDMLSYVVIAAMTMQLGVTIGDLLMHRAITGLTLIPMLIIGAYGLVGMISEAFERGRKS